MTAAHIPTATANALRDFARSFHDTDANTYAVLARDYGHLDPEQIQYARDEALRYGEDLPYAIGILRHQPEPNTTTDDGSHGDMA